MRINIDEILGAEGRLAQELPNYEPRPGQLALARAVEAALEEKRHLVGEAPTGVGKTLATLCPAILHAKRTGARIVYATATIPLQEQIIEKDLPFLKEVLPFDFTYALMKGRSHYLCPGRLHEALDDGFGTDDVDVAELVAWAESTDAGNIIELDPPPSRRAWTRICGDGDECDARRCEESDCFVARARRAARDADVIVTNFSMLFCHLKIREELGFDALLPSFDAVICDEAHEMATIARDFLGFRLTEFAVRRLARGLKRLGEEQIARDLHRRAKEYFERAREFLRAGRRRIKEPGELGGRSLISTLDAHQEAWRCVVEESVGKRKDEGQRRLALAGSVRARLLAVDELEGDNAVYWVEADKEDRLSVAMKPVSVAPALRRQLFNSVDTAVMVSATLATGAGSFDYFRREVGVPKAREIVVESPFNFEDQSIIFVPKMTSEPNSPTFPREVAIDMRDLLSRVGGRTLGLFTSFRNMHLVRERLEGSGHRILVQGEAERSYLIREFKEDVGSVLLGTTSFWTGIDVPGEALSCVMIDRIPFPTPDDPIIDFRSETEGRKAFFLHSFPQAQIRLRQGVGRLIRSTFDRGVIVIFDPRIIDKPYGRQLVQSLPSAPLTRDPDDVSAFFASTAGLATA